MTREYWKDKIAQWRTSGKSMAEFCRHEDISYWTFREWKQRLSKQSETKLVKLDTRKIPSADNSSAPIEIRLNGFMIAVPLRYEEAHLIRLINTLRGIS